MIVVDTSALMAIVNREEMANACIDRLADAPSALISAGTLAEVLIVASCRRVFGEMTTAIGDAALEVVPVTAAAAHRIGDIYLKWGKGFHPAALNYGDCFAYELATLRNCPLLFVGNDFAQTNVKRALG
jgi:ribonuclease VapC